MYSILAQAQLAIVSGFDIDTAKLPARFQTGAKWRNLLDIQKQSTRESEPRRMADLPHDILHNSTAHSARVEALANLASAGLPLFAE